MAVTVADVANELGRPTPVPPQSDQWQQWINDVELLIETQAARQGVPYDSIDQRLVDMVVRMAVASRIRTPADGATEVTVAVDDGSTTRKFGASASAWITDEWWELLGLDLPDAAQTASFTIEPAYARCSALDTEYGFGRGWR